jgi:D-amino-acid dehydrogenase
VTPPELAQLAGRPPKRAVVVGAGLVGLSVAWFLQEQGVEVCVVDRSGVAAGASWGNAGWLSPALAVPLPEPSVLRYGLRALLDPDAPLSVPPSAGLAAWRFLAHFALNCTAGRWRRSMAAYLGINALALGAYDTLVEGGVETSTFEAPIVAVFEGPGSEDRAALEHEIEAIQGAGQGVRLRSLSEPELRQAVPLVAPWLRSGLLIEGQRYIDPGATALALAQAVEERGGQVRAGFSARALRHGPGGITVEAWAGPPERGNAVVLATGAWLAELARPLGVRVPVHAGRGYSFGVKAAEPLEVPLYLPGTRVACTPYRGGVRVAGTMEIRSPDDPLNPARISSIIKATRPLLTGIDWGSVTEPWVGPRPVTADGLPLIGATRAPGVYVAGGHGMWGITLGPATGKLLAEQIVTGRVPASMAPFDPLRPALPTPRPPGPRPG